MVRKTLGDWYRTKFHGGSLAIHQKAIEKREVNVPLAFCRSIQSGLYSRNPDITITSPWHHPEQRRTMGLLATRLLDRIGMRATAKKVLLDVCLGGFGIMRVGYQNAMSWSARLEAGQRRRAREDAQKLFSGEDPLAQEGQDHAIHIAELTAVGTEWIQQGLGQQAPALFEALDRLVKSHRRKMARTPEAPVVQESSQTVWAVRVPLVLDGEPAFGWEVDCPFEEARYVWQRWRRPLKEVKANPYYRNTKDLVGNLQRAPETLPSFGDNSYEDWLSKEPTDVQGDVILVDGMDVVDISTGEWMAFVQGESRFLFKETYPSGDLLERGGFHKFSLVDDPDDGPGITPLEAAGSQIISINMGEGVRARLMAKSKPATIVDESILGQEELARIMETDVGDFVPARPKDPTRPIQNAFGAIPQPALSPENFMAIMQARGDLAQILGPGEARMGGGEGSKTATAASVVAESTTEFFNEWAARFEGTLACVAGDLVQLVKAYYEPEDIVKLVGPQRVQAWPDFRKDPSLLSEREDVTVDVGASLPGRREGEMRRMAELIQLLAGHPLVKQRILLNKAIRIFGYDPEELLMSPEEEAQMAQQQPETSGSEMHGGPETQVQASADAGGQSSEDINNAMRQKAATAGRQAQAAQQ